MSNNTVLFSECGRSQLKERAKDVLAGSLTIAAVIDKRSIAIPHQLNWEEMINEFFSGLWVTYNIVKGSDARGFEYADFEPTFTDDDENALGPKLFSLSRLRPWLETTDYRLYPGIYELAYSKDLAAMMVSGNWGIVKEISGSQSADFSPWLSLSDGVACFDFNKQLHINHNGSECRVLGPRRRSC